jgi:osmotically-inducible protein OsmY
MRTDNELERDVIEELHWDPSLAHDQIAVVVAAGIVTLTGTVPSYAERVAARHAVERINGVRAIADDIVVVSPPHHVRTDTELARVVAAALEHTAHLPVRSIHAAVNAGWVTLDGSVPWHYQRCAAGDTVLRLAGVRGVSNNITVAPAEPLAADAATRIENALRRSAALDCKSIIVLVADGQITLRGTVRSWAECRDAERAAWSAPGVRAVINRLSIAP